MSGAPIERIEVFQVPLAVSGVRAHGGGAAAGRIAGAVDVVLLKITDAAGASGWGEAAPWTVFTGSAEAAFAALDAHWRPLLLGRDPAERPALMAAAAAHLVGHPEARAALDTALLDLLGRRLGAPVWALLGGLAQARAPLSVSLADPDWTRDRALAERAWADGVRLFKLKTGIAEGAFDVARVESLRGLFGDAVGIRADYNQALAGFDAWRRVADLDALGLDFIEQPTPRRDWAALKALKARMATPLMLDESVFDAEEATRAIDSELADAVSVKIMKAGGPVAGQTVARIAAARGWAAYGGDMFESGLAHLAGLHMVAATPEIGLGCEFYQARYHLERDLLTEPFPIEDGCAVAPNGPGLGVAVDEDRVRATARRASAGEG